jgi:hypothetical protein
MYLYDYVFTCFVFYMVRLTAMDPLSKQFSNEQ